MVESTPHKSVMMRRRPRRNAAAQAEPAFRGQGDGTTLADQPYDRRRLSYATTFDNAFQRHVIQTMEFFTGKLKLLRLIRRFEAMGVPHGQGFWGQALGVMGIDLTTPQAEIDKTKDPNGPLTSEERAELAQLRRELKRVTMERDFLKRAAAYFAKETAPSK